MATPRPILSRRFYLKHRAEIRARVKKYVSDNIEKIRESARNKYANLSQEKKKLLLDYQVNYRKENKERLRPIMRAYHKKWSKTEKGRAWYKKHSREKEYKRRALLKKLGKHTEQEWENLKRTNKFLCAKCKKKKKLTRDHIKPLSKGGDNTIDNIQPLCALCNSLKHTKEEKYT